MINPLISIIIPVYNVELYLRDCINSVLTQTYTNLEVILIDDGSSDNCPSICDEYQKKDNRIKVIHQENQGLSGARNCGIKIAQGEYLSFVDSDDILHPDYINLLLDAINNSGYKISQCNNFSFSDTLPLNQHQNHTIKTLQLLDIFDIQNSMCAWGKLFHKSLFDNIIFPVGKIHEDEFIIYKILYKAKNIAFCNSILYFYRTRDGSIMQHREEVFYTDFLEALLKNYKYFYSLNEYQISEKFLLRLTYLKTDYNKYIKTHKIPLEEKRNISKIIYNLPKKGISFFIRIKVLIKII